MGNFGLESKPERLSSPFMPAYRSRPVGALHISVWQHAADGPDVQSLHAEVARLAGEVGNPVGALLVVEPGVPLSTPAARDAAMVMVKDLGERLAAIGLVIEGSGFGAAAVRGMFTGIGLVARPGFPWKMFAEADTATAWMIDRVAEGGASPPPIVASLRSIEHLRE